MVSRYAPWSFLDHRRVRRDIRRAADRLHALGQADIQSLALLLAVPLLGAVATRPMGLHLLSDLFDVAFLLSLAAYGAVVWQRRPAAIRGRRRR